MTQILKVKVKHLKEGYKIAEEVIKNRSTIIPKDTVLDKSFIEALGMHGINEVSIYVDEKQKEEIIGKIVNEIFSRVEKSEFMQKLQEEVLKFRIKNNI
jgi:hypothetical protein